MDNFFKINYKFCSARMHETDRKFTKTYGYFCSIEVQLYHEYSLY